MENEADKTITENYMDAEVLEALSRDFPSLN